MLVISLYHTHSFVGRYSAYIKKKIRRTRPHSITQSPPLWPSRLDIASITLLVNRHPARQLGLLVLHLVDVVDLLLLLGTGRLDQVMLESFAEIAHANEGVDDGEDDEDDGQDGKGSQTSLHGSVVIGMRGLVDADQLKEEVGEGAEIEDDDSRHAQLDFPANEESG